MLFKMFIIKYTSPKLCFNENFKKEQFKMQLLKQAESGRNYLISNMNLPAIKHLTYNKGLEKKNCLFYEHYSNL